MSEVVKLRTRVEVDEEAAVWAWRMESASVSAIDLQAHDMWLKQDPRHARAFRELSAVWRTMDGLAEAKRDEKIATFTQTPLRPPHRYWRVCAAAAVLIVGATLGTFWWARGGELQSVATAVGQQRSVTLADGSRVTLNTNTLVETNLRQRTRDIYLRKGEAHFQVAHDAARPFVVHAGDAVVSAIGTAFDVRVRPDQHLDVVVSEGWVDIRTSMPVSDPSALSTRHAVSAGQRMSTASPDMDVVPVSPQQLSRELAWREGAVVFDGKRLSEAVAEVERYTDTRITISDPANAALLVDGRFRTGDLQAFFDALEAALPVTVRHTPAGAVIDPR